MTVLLAAVGAIVVFGAGVVAGVLAGRRSRPDVVSPAAPAASTATVSIEQASPAYELVERHGDGFVLADRAGDIVYRNAAARRLHGTHVGVLLDEVIDRHIELATRHGRSDEVLDMYGPPKVVLMVEAHALDDGVIVYVDDASERSRIEQARTDFVANVSHELKTPVGALAVLAETLEEETDPEIIRRVVARIMGEAERASRTIDDLMEFSRIELGDERAIEPVLITSALAEAIGRVTEIASQREIGLTSLAPAERLDGVTVQADRRQLVSALGNLIENAVKYSEHGGQVTIRTRIDDGFVDFSVIDQGIGIPRRHLDRIFERFYRVDRARSRQTGGTGLGLSIVRHVAHHHHGQVSVESVEGEGSTFTLRLPIAAATSPGLPDERHGADGDDAGGDVDVADGADGADVESDRGVA